MDKKTRAFLERAPAPRERDIEEINGLFTAYIFRRASTREVWTSCCGRHEALPENHELWREEHVPEPKKSWGRILSWQKKKEETPCPFCGRAATVKDLKYTGQRKNLWEERRFVMLRWQRGALWAVGAWAVKDYFGEEGLTAIPRVKGGSTYRFSEKAVEYVLVHWFYVGSYYHKLPFSDFNKNTVDTPFQQCAKYGMGYDVIAANEIEKSPVRYCGYRECLKHKDNIVKWLHLAFVYPRQVEMLTKAGMYPVVYDLAERGVKNAQVLNWPETNPKRFFKLTPQETAEFLQSTKDIRCGRDVGVIRLYKRLRRRGESVSMAEAAEIFNKVDPNEDLWIKAADGEHLNPMRLYRYLDGQGMSSFGAALQAWKDYVDHARKLGDALQRSNVLLPANLGRAHDSAADRYRNQRQRLQKKAEQDRLRAMNEAYVERKKRLEMKFTYAAEGLVIRIPENGQAIMDEGRELQHCVGGYAERHLRGDTTILFLRKETEPDKPFLTIEMWGNTLHQIHGYRNEGVFTQKGRFAPDPREEYAYFLDPWLKWVSKGSPRRKDGTPRIPKMKEKISA